MIIKYFGQSCIQIKTKSSIIIIDPYGSEVGLKLPNLRADIILVTHDHVDHNNVAAVKPKEGKEKVAIFSGAGEFEHEGVLISGIPSWHDNEQKEKNFMYSVYVDGVRLAHLGDLGQKNLFEDQLELLDNVDILFVPVGGKFTIDGEAAFEITNQIEPKIVIPLHYKVEGSKYDLETADKFLKMEGKSPDPIEELKIEKETLPKEEERELVVLSVSGKE
ncbi:MAG: MBL fold metallo-hydrolase [Patescibacteria group bacterium]|nr:MBL fold metallo-hydrolase [Patescibacteria group bacterium]